jgi:hypothetical protein
MARTGKQQKATKGARRGSNGESARKPSRTGLLVGLSIASVVIAVVISFPPVTPLIVTAPVVPALVRKTREADYRAVVGVSWRWAVSLFATALTASAFVPDRVSHSFLFAVRASEDMQGWLTGIAAGPPAGYVYIAAGTAAFVVVSVLTVGVLGCLLWSIALGASAVAAASLYAQGNNIVQITLIAVPPWQIAQFASGLFLLAPAAAFSRRAVFRVSGDGLEWRGLRRYALVAAGLFVLSLLLRLTIAEPYLALVRHWTIV